MASYFLWNFSFSSSLNHSSSLPTYTLLTSINSYLKSPVSRLLDQTQNSLFSINSPPPPPPFSSLIKTVLVKTWREKLRKIDLSDRRKKPPVYPQSIETYPVARRVEQVLDTASTPRISVIFRILVSTTVQVVFALEIETTRVSPVRRITRML